MEVGRRFLPHLVLLRLQSDPGHKTLLPGLYLGGYVRSKLYDPWVGSWVARQEERSLILWLHLVGDLVPRN